MRFILFIILEIALATNAMAQTTYSFSGLSWGDSLEAAHAKLEVAGFSGCKSKERIECRLLSNCQCNFSGIPIKHGYASFDKSGLLSVVVSVDNYSDTENTLRKKYGNPLPIRDLSQLKGFAKSEELLTLRWKTQSGESLEMNPSGVVTYSSAELNKQTESKLRADQSKF